MNKMVWVCALATALCGVLRAADANAEIKEQILALEHKAMDGWLAGNPGATLAASSSDITLFHAVTNGRLNGLAAVRKLYEGYRGTALFDRYEMADPEVQVSGDVAVLTYVLEQHNGGVVTRWNGTQVYERSGQSWRVIHTHWSMTNPPLPGAPPQP